MRLGHGAQEDHRHGRRDFGEGRRGCHAIPRQQENQTAPARVGGDVQLDPEGRGPEEPHRSQQYGEAVGHQAKAEAEGTGPSADARGEAGNFAVDAAGERTRRRGSRRISVEGDQRVSAR